MLTYKNVVVAENRHKVYSCEITNGEYVRLEVVEGIKMNTWFLQDYDDLESDKYYLESDIVEIYGELTDLDEDSDDEEDSEYGVKIDTESLLPFLTSVSNVYKYDSMEELDLIVKALDEPIVDGVGCSWDKDYKKGLSKSYGLLFFWSEYDDFSCGDPFTPYCKIIDGGIVQWIFVN
mgnify:FL=1